MNAHPPASDLSALRQQAQSIEPSTDRPAVEVVAALGAVQAQDYAASLWAIGVRGGGATQVDVEAAAARREIVRSWPMRGTLHWVAAADLHWLLALLAPRAIEREGKRLQREHGLDDATLDRCRTLVHDALQGGNALTRPEIYAALEAGGLPDAPRRGLHVLGRLAQEGLLCCGPKIGRQTAFVLLDEWLPRAAPVARDEALQRLALRYYAGHGPATVQDLAWWSGLTLADAGLATASAATGLERYVHGGREYWSAAGAAAVPAHSETAFLLPAFDELVVGYQDRSALLDSIAAQRVASSNGLFHPALLHAGRIIGTWKRTLHRHEVVLSMNPFGSMGRSGSAAVRNAAKRYGAFLELPLEFE